jgi:hypothetical protein
MLDRHERIVAPSELWLLRYSAWEQWREHKPHALHSLQEACAALGEDTDEASLEARWRGAAVTDVYRDLLERMDRRMGDAVLVDKTPGYANDPDVLRRSLALDPLLVWLVRHPLGVVHSKYRLLRKGPKYQGLPGLFRRGQDRVQALLGRGLSGKERRREAKWVRQNRHIRDVLAEVPRERQWLVRFEDLVLQPEATMQGLLERLGLPMQEAVLHPFDGGRAVRPGLGNPNFHTRSRIEAAPATVWQERYGEAMLRPETRALMDEMGVFRPGA